MQSGQNLVDRSHVIQRDTPGSGTAESGVRAPYPAYYGTIVDGDGPPTKW